MQDLTISFSGVAALAKTLNKPVTVFDLEATGFRGPKFGITEVCCFTVTTLGNGVVHGHLINPEHRIDPRVSQLTGITDAMVRNKETWGARYASHFRTVAAEHIACGFNVKTFDCPAVVDMNARYGFPIEEGFADVLDVRQLYLTLEQPDSKKGKLVEIAAFYGVQPQGNLHRAEADVILTLETLDAIIRAYGLERVIATMRPDAKRTPAPVTKRPVQVQGTTVGGAQALAALVNGGECTTVEALASRLGTDEKAAAFELGKAVDERLVSPLPFVNEETLEWLRTMLVEMPTETLTEGRLKPIYAYLAERRPPGVKLDYLQLRIGMLECGLSWSTLKPGNGS
jgi:DNA polymerase III epsilon subunit-like protein